jgi:transcriptional regulator with XRE-family HTH domain
MDIAVHHSAFDLNSTMLNSNEIRAYRRKRRESQERFWSRFGVTQSRGSRFELGLDIPQPVAILLKLYLQGVITDTDLGIARD